MKPIILICWVWMGSTWAYGQNTLSYKCTSLGGKMFKVDVQKAPKTIAYQGKNITIFRYDFQYEGSSQGLFYLYKYNGKSYVVDPAINKINPSVDQLFFSLPQRNYISLKLNGIFSNLGLSLDRFFSVNNWDFYFYTVKDKSENKSAINLSKIVFDGSMEVAEWQFINGAGKACQCTKEGIVVKLL